MSVMTRMKEPREVANRIIGQSLTQRAAIAVVVTCLSAGVWFMSRSAGAHPVFKTPLSGNASSRPAVFVDILDRSEILGDAELYLSVQSSRSPSGVNVLFPLNVGDFRGCMSRYIQLPFEVETGDELLLNLLDEDGLSGEDEKLVLDASKAAGYCVAIACSVYRPNLEQLISPGAISVAGILGNAVVQGLKNDCFENFGKGEFIVHSSRPAMPRDANRISLLDTKNRVNAQVRVYFPISKLQ